MEEWLLDETQRLKVTPLDAVPLDGSDTGFQNMLFTWEDKFFRHVFCVLQHTFKYMCDELRDLIPDNCAPPQFSVFLNRNFTTEFKVGAYLSYMGHCMDFEVLGHLCGAGRETVRTYVVMVAKAVCSVLSKK